MTKFTMRLSDRVRPPVNVLFVGINPGIRSAEIGHHFAGYSNRFWKLLWESSAIASSAMALPCGSRSSSS